MASEGKIVIRLLPPLMKEQEFLDQLSQIYTLGDSVSHLYIQGMAGSNAFQHPKHSRCYLQFSNSQDAKQFMDTVQDKPFGTESTTVLIPTIEKCLYQKWPVIPESVSKEIEHPVFKRYMILYTRNEAYKFSLDKKKKTSKDRNVKKKQAKEKQKKQEANSKKSNEDKVMKGSNNDKVEKRSKKSKETTPKKPSEKSDAKTKGEITSEKKPRSRKLKSKGTAKTSVNTPDNSSINNVENGAKSDSRRNKPNKPKKPKPKKPTGKQQDSTEAPTANNKSSNNSIGPSTTSNNANDTKQPDEKRKRPARIRKRNKKESKQKTDQTDVPKASTTTTQQAKTS